MTRDYSIDELTDNASFHAWARGRANAERKQYWDRWVQQSSEHRRKAREAQIQLTGFSFNSILVPHTSGAWNRLQNRIKKEQSPSEDYSESYQDGGQLWKYYGIVASAILILAISLTVFFTYRQLGIPSDPIVRKTVTTGYGQRKKITLSHRKSVMLAAHSTLTYVKGVKADQPERITLQGEAYFMAVPDSANPADTAFTIQTRDGKIADLGTKFVVSARKEGTKVVLKSGKVAISPTGAAGKQLVLDPGQMATVSRTSPRIEVKDVNPDIYTSWATKRIVFDHTSLPFVKKRLEQTFGVGIKICGKELARRSLSGSIKNAGLHVVISSLANALGTDYAIKNDEAYLGENCH